MNKIIISGIIIISALALFSRCADDDPRPQNNMLAQTAFGIYGANTDYFVFSEKDCQWVVSESGSSVRVQKDDMTQYFHIRYTGDPTHKGTSVEVALTSHGISLGQTPSGFTAKVLKAEADKAWLWHNASKTGFVIPVSE